MKLCRFVKEPLLWACLAAISLKVKQLDTAETAFAAIEQPEKVSFISELRENPSEIVKNATMALLLNKPILRIAVSSSLRSAFAKSLADLYFLKRSAVTTTSCAC